MDKLDELALAPLVFTFGFFNNKSSTIKRVGRLVLGKNWPTPLLLILFMVNPVISWLLIKIRNITRFWPRHYKSCKKFIKRGE